MKIRIGVHAEQKEIWGGCENHEVDQKKKKKTKLKQRIYYKYIEKNILINMVIKLDDQRVGEDSGDKKKIQV